jgi:hypothetical protein
MWMKVLSVVMVAGLTGCATLFSGGPDKIPVQSNPPGASVYVDEMLVGQTPTTVTLKRGQGSGTIKIAAPGYAPVVVQRDKKIQGWFWVNVILFSPVGIVVDLVTGNVKRYDRSPISVGLVPAGGMPPAGMSPTAPAPSLFGGPVPPSAR